MKLIQELEHDVSGNQLLEQIGTDCSKFVLQPTQIFRGIRKTGPLLQKLAIRTNRQPLDTNAVCSSIFNYLFYKQFGIRDVRMRAAFATQEYERARRYGNVSWIIPTDECTLWVCEGIEDTLAVMDKIAELSVSLDLLSDWDKAVEATGGVPHSGAVIEYIEQKGTRENQQVLEQIESSTRAEFLRYKKISPDSTGVLPKGEIMVVGPAMYAVNIDWAIRRFSVADLNTAFDLTIEAIKSA